MWSFSCYSATKSRAASALPKRFGAPPPTHCSVQIDRTLASPNHTQPALHAHNHPHHRLPAHTPRRLLLTSSSSRRATAHTARDALLPFPLRFIVLDRSTRCAPTLPACTAFLSLCVTLHPSCACSSHDPHAALSSLRLVPPCQWVSLPPSISLNPC